MRNPHPSAIMQVNDIKVIPLDTVTIGKMPEKVLFAISFANFLFCLYCLSRWEADYFKATPAIPIASVVACIVTLIFGLIFKHAIGPEKDQNITRIVREAIEPKALANGTYERVSINEEVIDKIITYLKINGLVGKSNKRLVENQVARELVGQQYTRIVSRMFQHEVIKPNQGIMVTQKTKNYYKLAKELMNMGITPGKVYFEDASDCFAVVIEDVADAHFASLAQEKDSQYSYHSTNEILSFISQIKIN